MKTDTAIHRWAEQNGLEFEIPDGYPEAFVGVHRGTEENEEGETIVRAIYDEAKVLRVLRERDGMSMEAAREFFDFNIAGGAIGPGAPMFIQVPVARG